MDRLMSTSLIIIPILFAVGLGMIARKRSMLKAEEVRGLQQFVIKFGLPCALFNSCLNAQISAESLGSMALIILFALVAAFASFRLRKTRFHYHNLPLLFCAKETGMIGIPLFILLFGSAQSYRMGVLDLAQGMVAIPVLSILSADPDEDPSVLKILRQVFTSPMLLCSLLGLVLNLTGVRDLLGSVGIGGIVTQSTSFLGDTISALMLFSVGYNFSFTANQLKTVFKFTALNLGQHMIFCILAQLILCLIPNVDPLTRWAVLLYYVLPGSYVTQSLGRNEDEYSMASGVCSLMTLFCLVVFCLIAVFTV